MSKRIDQRERAARAWQILTAQAEKGKPITYGELAHRMGVHHRVCRFFLGLIQDYCMGAGLPPLQSLVVNKRTGVPGEGYHATARHDTRIREAHGKVFDFSWGCYRNPFE